MEYCQEIPSAIRYGFLGMFGKKPQRAASDNKFDPKFLVMAGEKVDTKKIRG